MPIFFFSLQRTTTPRFYHPPTFLSVSYFFSSDLLHQNLPHSPPITPHCMYKMMIWVYFTSLLLFSSKLPHPFILYFTSVCHVTIFSLFRFLWSSSVLVSTTSWISSLLCGWSSAFLSNQTTQIVTLYIITKLWAAVIFSKWTHRGGSEVVRSLLSRDTIMCFRCFSLHFRHLYGYDAI